MYKKRNLTALILAGLAGTCTPVLAQEAFTGMFRLSRTTSEVVDAPTAQSLSDIIPVDEQLDWQVYVPESYRSDRPPGIFIYIDPNGWGRMPEHWQQVFSNHNLIWVGPKRKQRSPSVERSVWATKLGMWAIQNDYAIDQNRLYIGSSGSGAMTALNVILNANEISGAVYMQGSFYWNDSSFGGVDSLRRKYHVFITGSNDKAKDAVRRDHRNYKKDGIENAKLIFETGKLGKMPEPEHMDEALRYLDSRLKNPN